MKKVFILVIAVILLGLSIYTVNTYNTSSYKNKVSQENEDNNTKNQNNTVVQPIEINPNVFKTKAIDFKLKDLEGKEFSLSDFKGKKVFLNFWATWCPPCRAEMPEIEKLYQETKDSNLVIITIDLGEPLDTVKSFIDNKYHFKVLLDSDQSVASKYDISSLPSSYFIDVNGNIAAKNIGAMNLEQMKAYIKILDN